MVDIVTKAEPGSAEERRQQQDREQDLFHGLPLTRKKARHAPGRWNC